MKAFFLLFCLLAGSGEVLAQKGLISASTDWQKPQTTPRKSINLRWNSPVSEQSEQAQPLLKLSVCVTTADTTARYQVYHNNKLVGGVRRGFKKAVCDMPISEEIALVLGYNEVKVMVTGSDGNAVTESRSVTLTAPAGPVAQQRVALILANTAYPKSPLANPVNDGQAMKAELERLGFDVIFKENQPLRELSKTIDTFMEKLEKSNVGLVFYAGHGMMVSGENYIQPVNAAPTSEADVEYECYSLKRLAAKMQTANPNGANLVFWDACRNNPYRSWRRGANDDSYALMQPPVGTMYIYATEPGKQALDNPGEKNGLFTSELIRHISEPGLDIYELVDRIDTGLVKRGYKQPPYTEGRLRGKFVFK